MFGSQFAVVLVGFFFSLDYLQMFCVLDARDIYFVFLFLIVFRSIVIFLHIQSLLVLCAIDYS